ncbi:MAG: cysteine hydrolase [Candidatus Aminicenantes bacterium]|nr:MAG: cysteine hydrolase [Candidatus Aminicenantes bacterium]
MDKKKEAYALLIIDMQKDFVLPGAPALVAGAYATIPHIQQVLQLSREKKWPIFHVVREYRPDGSDIETFRKKNFLEKQKYAVSQTPGCEIVDELKPLPGEYRIVKKRFSAFMKTELDLILRQLKISHLVVCGTQYPTCIRATITDAIAYGYDITLLTDAASAQTPEIAEANIRDIREMGVTCLNTQQFITGSVGQ